VLGLAVACEQDDVVRPAYVTDCNDPECREVRNGVPIDIVGAGANVSGEAGAGGGGGMPGPGVGTLAGSVLELAASDLQTRRNLLGGVEVRAPRAGGATNDPVSAQTDTSGTFRLEGILAAGVTWVGVGNFSSSSVGPYIDTLQAVDATSDDFVNLLVTRRDALEDAIAVAFLGEGVSLEAGLAHVALRFVRASGAPIDGVHIVFPDIDLVPTAYDAGDAFSSALDVTSERGMALLVNLQAPAYPGGSTSVVAELDGQRFTAQLQVAAGALTIVSAVLPDP
jgi:hypothetical protein